MKKRFIFLAFLMLSLLQAHSKVSENLALKVVSVTASCNNSTVYKVNDGVGGTRLTADRFWSSYHGEAYKGNYEYLEFRWDRINELRKFIIFWAESGDTISYPTDAYLATWDGENWNRVVTLTAPDSTGKSTDIDTINTNRIRIYMKSATACGVREVRIMGVEGDECVAAVLTDNTVVPLRSGEVVLSPTLTLPEGEEEEPRWEWTLPDGSVATTASITATELGEYTVTYERQCGMATTLTYTVYDPSVSYQWPSYQPTLYYNYRDEYGEIEPPTKMLPEKVGCVGTTADGWWAVGWGKNCSMYVTDTAKKNLLAKMNEDFAYFRDEMGWPPDKRARNGYYSTVYVYGSGLSTDDADSTALGGWQSATTWQNSSWPMVFISYYPLACFDPAFKYDKYQQRSVTDQTFQQNACVHEGIHAIFADLDGCRNSAWYHEAGNTWLQGEAEVKKTGIAPTSMGWLSAGNMIAPFMPIECYSGWLQDGSFGGPSAEGVNMFNDSGQQLCTWRNLLGGVQYGELFPHFVSEILGQGSIPWIWRYCKSRVLEGMADSLGEAQMRRLIVEYRSRQAMIDVGMWSKACKKLIDDNWLVSIKQEYSPHWKDVEVWKATPYVNMYECGEDSTDWWKPEYRTTPGWSGANQIPLHVDGEAGNFVTVHFQPLGKNMVCQLAYRTKSGNVYYSHPTSGDGDVTMQLQEAPANNVVIAIVCNTDYIYEGDETRKAHFDYRLKMGENVHAPAKAQLKWYNYTATIRDNDFLKGIDDANAEEGVTFGIHPAKTVVSAGESVPLRITGGQSLQVQVAMYDMNGRAVYSQSFLREGNYEIPANAAPGMYILHGYSGKEKASAKIIVK